MRRAIRLGAEAERDVFEAVAWYEGQRRGLGHDFLNALEASLLRITEGPLQFPVVHRDIRRVLLARFPFGVFFRVEPNDLVVLAVLHATRDPANWRERS